MKRERISVSRILILVGIIAPIFFCVVFTAAGLLRPGYSAVRQTVSALAVGPHGWIQTANFLLFGLLLIAFGIGFHRSQGSRVALALFVLLGIGFALLALFPTDGGGARTWRGLRIETIRVHLRIADGLGLLSPLGCFVMAYILRRDIRWRRLLVYTIISGILSLLLAWGWRGLPRAWMASWRGLYERVLIAVPLAWVEAMALRLYRLFALRFGTFVVIILLDCVRCLCIA